jgi:hypothetical protein
MVLLQTTDASALTQNHHYQISYDSCAAVGLPHAFCDQVGTASYNVDYYEFDVMAAHGQMRDHDSACDGATNVLWRGHWFGEQIRIAAINATLFPTPAYNGLLARYVGRLLHMVQDNCAHSGMTNPQHAWYSMSDLCDGTEMSPDEQPAAVECARWESDGVLSALNDVLSDWGAVRASFANVEVRSKKLTGYSDACNYLGSADQWDGVDRRWDNEYVVPSLRMQTTGTIRAEIYPWTGNICNDMTSELLVSYLEDVDVSDGPPSCPHISAVCLGKADEYGEGSADEESQPPPVGEETTPTASRESDEQAVGCALSTGGGTRSSLGFLAMVLFFLASRRSRRAGS